MRNKIKRVLRLAIFSIIFLPVWCANASISVKIESGSQTVSVGETVALGAVVTTTAGEAVVGYQWLMSTNNQSPFIAVGNLSTLSLNNIQTTNTGYYYVSVSYQSGGGVQSVSSSPINLIVVRQPGIVTQPVSVSSPIASNVVFSVTVGGVSPLHFQWRQNGTNLVDNGRITGSAGTNLAIGNLTLADSGNYDMVATNLYGSATSQVATLQVYLAQPVFTSPTNVLGKQGCPFNYPITATGTAPITFGATGLPDGLTLDPTNGVISGVPTVAGVFDIDLFATNDVQVTDTNLVLTLADDIPVITSATNATGQQAVAFSYTITATNNPVSFSASPLPAGLSVDPVGGVISGVPLVSGSFDITILVTNAYGSDSETLTLDLATSAPIITSPLVENGLQGQPLSYSIVATNSAVSFSASPLPTGLSLNAASGVISGVPLVNGTFAVTIGAMNQYGTDSQTLTLNLATGLPVITSSLNATGGEEQMGFDYSITASNSPTIFWASDLPVGLTVNTNSGAITGTPIYAGNYNIPLFAANAYGVGTATLQLTVTNLVITNLFIADVMTNYFSPYVLEFKFSLRDSADPTSRAVVASPSLMSVAAFESGVPVSPSDTSVFLKSVGGQAAKVLKGYLVLDFSEGIASLANGDTNGNGLSDAVNAEIADAQSFVNEQPPGSQIGVYEFHRDDEAPQQVMSLTADKNLLDTAIAGIWTNYVQNFPAGSRAWDALGDAITNLGPANSDESHYIVFMSDGNDDSSTNTLDGVIAAATNAVVQIYAVGIGADENTNDLETLTSSTEGRYYASTNLADLSLDFAQIGKDLRSQYILRWATLQRSTNSFMPSFQISYEGVTADSPANPPPVVTGTNFVTVTNSSGDVSTNDVYLYTTNYIIPPYTPTNYGSNVLAGSLRLVADADENPTEITLRATYAPRYIRQLHLHYRANWPATLSLESTNPGEMLENWTLTETNDGAGGQWALLSSPNPSLLTGSIPFADFGKLLTFSFQNPIVASNAFSEFQVDNTIYTNTASTNFYGFTLTNTNAFFTFYVAPPPHGTPIPWLKGYGFTNNFAAAELLDPNGNGFAVWQDYLAGLNPLDTNSTFAIQSVSSPTAPQITFNTVLGRTYQIDWTTSLNGSWTVLLDGIAGTGGNVTYTDQRNLSGVSTVFYRVSVDTQ
jgi:von Willebrand factor type A domain/Putative Ig domain/Immunoglobulin I-set domain